MSNPREVGFCLMSAAPSPHSTEATNGTTTLTASQMAMVLAGLRRVGAYGEVHLVIRDGRLRFIRTVQSMSVTDEEQLIQD